MSEVRARIAITLVHERSADDFAGFISALGAFVRDQNRIGNVEIVVDGGLPENVFSGTWIELEEGRVEAHKNEISIISNVSDPSGLRLASSSPEPTLGHFSGNSLRADGRQEMVSYILFKRWETMRHLAAQNLFGTLEIWVRDPRRSPLDDQQFAKVIAFEPDGIHLYMPVTNHWVGARIGARARRQAQREKEKRALAAKARTRAAKRAKA